MAAVITCDQCNAQMSKNASICPGCHAPPKWNRGQCRACGQALAVSNHRYIDYVSSVVVVNGQGGSRSRAFIHHVPCPKCFEPKPLLQFVDRPVVKFLAVVAIILAVLSFGAIAISMMSGGPLDKLMGSAGRSGKIAIAIGLAVVALAVLGIFLSAIVALNSTNRYFYKFGPSRVISFYSVIGILSFLAFAVASVVMPSRHAVTVKAPSKHTTVKKKHKSTDTDLPAPTRSDDTGQG